PPQGGRKHPHQEFIQINTTNILFVCGGTFEGLEEIVRKRAFKDQQAIGFQAGAAGREAPNRKRVMAHLGPDDLLAYGMIPEFVGRMPMIVALDPLEKADLLRILTEPKNALVRQYQSLLALDGVELEFTSDALEAAADQALKQKTGARGLRATVEETLLDVMYEIPSLLGVARCLITGDVIRKTSPPLLFNAAGASVHLPPQEQSA
ncbi:MAG: AAA family ATPase, partial [Chloroflexi bacterium]|nr:AAA family ATPase [Chloroflexota bacterium]